MMTTELFSVRGATGSDGETGERTRLFQAFDEFLDRMPAWIFHSLGGLTAFTALWFALAFLGGLPGSIVEWIALAMFGTFAYAVGFMIPLVLTYLVETATRFSVLLAIACGGALVGAVSLPISF